MDKKVVVVQLQETITYNAEVEMTEDEYNEWCDKIDNARGFQREVVAQDLFDTCRINRMTDGDVTDTSIEDFVCRYFEDKK